jgi:MFS family permease
VDTVGAVSAAAGHGRLSRDFWWYFAGQATSALGGSFTQFALPLLIFQLTGSATSLGAAMATTYLPYLLFGLVIGAITDRVDRRRMMIGTDIARGVLVALLPTLALMGALHSAWIYVVMFLQSTLQIFFDSGQFAGVASLVDKDQLVTANGRIQASFSVADVIGPVLAGVLVAVVPVVDVLWVDAGSFLLSALTLALIRRSFNEVPATEHPGVSKRGRSLLRSLAADMREGLRYVWRHPVLRTISIMMAIVNLFGSTTNAQLVLYAKQQLHATNSQIGYLFAAGGIGIVGLSLLAGPLRQRWRFSIVALTAMTINGLATIGLGLTSTYALALVLWGLIRGVGLLFNINTLSLRQQIVPNRLLGRVMSIAGVLAWSAIPLGSLVGGLIVSATGRVGLVYSVIGAVTAAVALGFWRSPLGRAERYLPGGDLAHVADQETAAP